MFTSSTLSLNSTERLPFCPPARDEEYGTTSTTALHSAEEGTADKLDACSDYKTSRLTYFSRACFVAGGVAGLAALAISVSQLTSSGALSQLTDSPEPSEPSDPDTPNDADNNALILSCYLYVLMTLMLGAGSRSSPSRSSTTRTDQITR